MRRSLVALALFTTAALAALDPVRPPPTELLLGRHGDDEDEEPSHEGGMEGMNDHHSSAGSFNSSRWYGPDGRVMEPVPGLNSPMLHTHHQCVRFREILKRSPFEGRLTFIELRLSATILALPLSRSGATTPQTMLNETDILMGHDPNPLSYWVRDFDPTSTFKVTI